ncbi:uncharacterized protein BT62DRAFT_933118 [Guyanagaster necrorhizus]|uniref:Uncharacterized protein n=1 Tax=Guyanagaster necrorhizus TaxID=856835 RepID=A0A9P8ARK2_9AGAR|nr:uncharacterized protein BT62DRAFT_933118 [Guyanagaster necrorhizus MCA 3950]KAG7445279.1 hypothetical protein BT62DRAFT_933118 [Guyanagaster necrorhizus MCA 3950]
MFQVASYPTPFSTLPQQRQHCSSVQLPATLARPRYSEVSASAIEAVSPELAGVPPDYIRRNLRSEAPQMLAGISALAPSHLPTILSKSHLPGVLSVPIRSPSRAFPTHVLAISSSKIPSEHCMVFPIHALVLASHCAHLPAIPPAHSQAGQSLVKLPVLPFALPSPQAFGIIHNFMYTHRLEPVFRSLLPVPTGFFQSISHETVLDTLDAMGTCMQLSAYLCSQEQGDLQKLTTHAVHVKELWQDMIALGIYSTDLWDAVDLAWRIVIGALTIAARNAN